MATIERVHAIGHRLDRAGLVTVASAMSRLLQLTFGVRLPASVELGEGTYFSSGGLGTVVHRRARIGSNCVISASVTIGSRGGYDGAPTIEDSCFIGTGARVLGPVRIGAGSVVGANAVVIEDVPAHSVVVGVPARIVKRDIDATEFASLAGWDA